MKQITEKRFKLFYDSCISAIDRLGLHGWYIEIGKGDTGCNFATSKGDNVARRADITINKNDSHSCDADIVDTAYHEVCEVLLSKIEAVYKTREGFDDYDLWVKFCEGERHEIIQRICKLLKYIKILEDKIDAKRKR